jgi:hypothetical protein
MLALTAAHQHGSTPAPSFHLQFGLRDAEDRWRLFAEWYGQWTLERVSKHPIQAPCLHRRSLTGPDSVTPIQEQHPGGKGRLGEADRRLQERVSRRGVTWHEVGQL